MQTCELLQPSEWNRDRLKSLLHSMQKKKILVLGDIGVDRYTHGDVERISPEAPVPIVAVKQERLKLGLAANVADNVRALGGIPLMSGLVGKDRTAQDLKSLMRSLKIPQNFLVTDPTRRTTLKERIVSESQQLLRVDFESLHSIEPKYEKQVLTTAHRGIQQSDAIIVEDYAKGLLKPGLMKEVFRRAKAAGKAILVDPNVATPVSAYRGATLLTPNKREAEALAEMKIHDDRSLLVVGRKILSDTDAKHVVITRGKDGMAIFSRGEKAAKLIPTFAREVFDVSGAGDTVIAVLALALSAGASVIEACVLGNLAAGVEVGKRGTATVSVDEILVALEFFGVLQ